MHKINILHSGIYVLLTSAPFHIIADGELFLFSFVQSSI